MTLQVRIRGIEALRARLSDQAIGDALGRGLARAGLIVQEAAQKTVHSPDNQFIGKAGHSVATGRLQASIGTSPVRGTGLGRSVAVGTAYGKGGLAGGTFARSAARTPSGRPASRRTRTGGRKNRGDVRIYGPIEEKRHPFLAPALDDNADRVQDVIEEALTRALGG